VATALEELDTQFVFQLFHRDTQGWLADEAGLGGTAEMTFLRQCDDVV
jgi:hypothetical protein